MRHLLNTVFCTGELKTGERITLPLIGKVTPIPPAAGVGGGENLNYFYN